MSAKGCQQVPAGGSRLSLPRAGELRVGPRHTIGVMSSDLSSSPSEVSSPTGSGRLTPERVKTLAECLIAGRTRAETADALGVSPRTVSRWKKSPVVQAEVNRLRSRENEPRVEDVLIRLLKSDDEHIRLMAVRETLRWEIQRARVEPEPKPEPPVTDGYILVRQEPFR
jgi:predicted transcriptional regulator